MRTWIRILLLIKVMGNSVRAGLKILHGSILNLYRPPGFHSEPPQLLNFDFDPDPDPAVGFDADPCFQIFEEKNLYQ
jgi:hypothetical protein